MFCIQLIHKTGGSTTIRSKTVEECKRQISIRGNKDCIVVTLPYEVFKAPKYENVYDVSIPEDFRPSLGEEIIDLYLNQE